MYKPIPLLAALLLAVMPLKAQAQTLDEDMQTLRDICVELRTAFTQSDRSALFKWGRELETYGRNVGCDAFGKYLQCLNDVASQDSLDGHICFDTHYVTLFLLNNAQPLQFKSTSLTRGGTGEPQVAHKVVPAGAQLDFCIKECEGPLQLFIVAEREEGITMTITAGNEAVAVESPTGGVCQAAWQQPTTDTDVHFSLSNSSAQDTYCYIAFRQYGF